MPVLLDLYCGEGVAARGYAAAGWDILGVDDNPEVGLKYPYEFVCADALEFLSAEGQGFDAAHASPPCHAYTVALPPAERAKRPDLVAVTRDALVTWGKPWIMENVPGAPMKNHIILCGSMFDLVADDEDGTQLQLIRHRLFESNHYLRRPGPCRHDPNRKVAGVYGGGSDGREGKGYTPPMRVREALMGVPPNSCTRRGLSQGIPPAYTQYLGAQMLRWV